MGITVTSDDNQSEENTAGYNEGCTSASEVRSTKRPTSTKEPKVTSKRKKRETQEDLLLQKALSCMEKAEKNTAKRSDDDDDIFAQYNIIASELRSIENPQAKRLIKWRIQSLIFSAHSGYAMQPGPSWQYQEGPLSGQFPQDQLFPPSSQFVPTPSRHGSGSTPSPFSIPSPPFPEQEFD